ncbi:hypothetical protein ALP54_03551 [Pseudomonas amygdali pv. lachrymans]|nr:hypothetical protein ALP54_03551 [Pseudomonas amygdali pv. lachrymans]
MMTIHVAPIVEHDFFGQSGHKLPYQFRVYQMYRQANKPDTPIVGEETFWWGNGYADQDELSKALGNPEILECITNELRRDALNRHWDGFEVASTVIAFDPEWKQGYAFDSLDARHLKRALRHHLAEIKPNIGDKPHLAWTITKSEGWGESVDAHFQDKIQNLRPRAQHLEAISHYPDHLIAHEFSRTIEVWFEKGNGLERVGSFLLGLMQDGKFATHRQCLEMWGSTLLQKPETLFSNLRVSLIPGKPFNPGETNPLITPKDSFIALNTLLSLFPDACLSGQKLLGDTWLKALGKPDCRDASMVAILAGYARYQRSMGIHESNGFTYQERKDGKGRSEESICTEYWQRLGDSAGVGLEGILSAMGEFPEGGSKPVQAFFQNLILSSYNRASYDSHPQPIAMQCGKEHILQNVPQALDVILKARLLGHPDFTQHYVSKVPLGQDRDYFKRIIRHPFVTLEQIKAVMPYERFERGEMEELDAVDPQMARAYVAGMTENQISLQIFRHNIPPKLLPPGKHRDDVMGTDLGL